MSDINESNDVVRDVTPQLKSPAQPKQTVVVELKTAARTAQRNAITPVKKRKLKKPNTPLSQPPLKRVRQNTRRSRSATGKRRMSATEQKKVEWPQVLEGNGDKRFLEVGPSPGFILSPR
jgi:hypothetical protein